MAKSVNQRLKVFYLRRILVENTDNKHYITMAEIIAKLGAFGIKAERKSVYSDIELLRELGYDIINHKRLGYAVVKKTFNLEDMELIFSAINQFNANESQKDVIRNKFKHFLSKYEVEVLM